MLQVAPDATVVVDGDGRIVGLNAAAARLFGYETTELLGAPVEKLIPERFRQAHRRERTSFTTVPRRRDMGVGRNLFGRRSDATEFPVDISLAPLSIGGGTFIAAAVRDGTDRIVAASAVSHLAAIVGSTQDGIVTLTTAGVVTTWNRAAERIFGTPSVDAIGRYIGAWVPTEEMGTLEEQMGALLGGGPSTPRDALWLKGNGKVIDVAVSLVPLHDEHGELDGFSLVIRNIVERKAAEIARLRLQRQREAAAEIRASLFSEAPLEETLELVCARVWDLTGAFGTALVQRNGERWEVAARAGSISDATALERARALPEHRPLDPPEPSLDVAGHAGQTLTVTLSGQSAPRALLVLALPLGCQVTAELLGIIEGLGGLGVVALDASQDRTAYGRLLVAHDRERQARDLALERLMALGGVLQSAGPVPGGDDARRLLRQGIEDLDAAVEDIWSTLSGVTGAAGGPGGVRERLVGLVERASETLGFRPSLEVDGPLDLVQEDVQAHAVAVTEEALTSIARQDSVTSARVLVRTEGGRLSVLVEDDGRSPVEDRLASGLEQVRDRADELGTRFELDARPEGGARLLWESTTSE